MQPCREGKTGLAEKAASASHSLPGDSAQPVKEKLIPSKKTPTTKSLTALPFAGFKQLRPMNLNVSIRTSAGAGGCSVEKASAVRRQRAPPRARSQQRKLWSSHDFHWPGRRSGHGFASWLWVEGKCQRGTEKFLRGMHRESKGSPAELATFTQQEHQQLQGFYCHLCKRQCTFLKATLELSRTTENVQVSKRSIQTSWVWKKPAWRNSLAES